MGFCPSCGKEIPDGSNFCPYCSVRLEAVETDRAPARSHSDPPDDSRSKGYLAIIPNVSSSEPAGTYELYVEGQRFVLLKTQPRTSSWAAGGGLLGAAITAGVDRARKKTYDPDLPLDAKIGLDKDNYVLPYDRVERIVLNKGTFGSGKEVEVRYWDEEGKTRKVRYGFGKFPEVFGRALSRVELLEGKVDASVPGYAFQRAAAASVISSEGAQPSGAGRKEDWIRTIEGVEESGAVGNLYIAVDKLAFVKGRPRGPVTLHEMLALDEDNFYILLRDIEQSNLRGNKLRISYRREDGMVDEFDFKFARRDNKEVSEIASTVQSLISESRQR